MSSSKKAPSGDDLIWIVLAVACVPSKADMGLQVKILSW
jgi:hypothetical protein